MWVPLEARGAQARPRGPVASKPSKGRPEPASAFQGPARRGETTRREHGVMTAARQRAVAWPVRVSTDRRRAPAFSTDHEGQREQNQKKRGSRARRVVTKSRVDLAINTQLLLVKGERFQ